MYLMNVPPVAATQTEWRPCGPPGGYSLPVCFNDSDTELSARGTPITDKVQMIIESLRSTQSSLEMGDEIEGNGLSGQEGHPQVCKVAVGSCVGARSKPEKLHEDASSPNNHESTDSDSDDSVDRGIEEAILEYLKEKDDHKRKAEPCAAFLQSSKIPRKTPSIPEVSRQNSDSSTLLTASSQFPKSIKTETPTAPAAIPIKKYIKNKASISENTLQNFSFNKSAVKSLVQEQSPSPTIATIDIAVQCPIRIKVEEESDDSSSDDGIEEAIQRYQLEKKEQQDRKEPFAPYAFKEESDSTSDDGIEEAIRCYQIEQLKEKSGLKPFLHEEQSFSKSLMHAVGSSSSESTKKHKLRKKRARAEKEGKSLQPPSSSGLVPKTTLSDGSKAKGNGLLSFKVGDLKEQPAPAPPKVNTTAELMCAEAILDISKTVMPPGAFHHGVGLSSCATTESSLQSSPPENCPYDESSDSSVDSEDGIEQEIRKFLEQKAQMHKQSPSAAASQEPHGANDPENVKATEVQKKPPRLSLTQRRKQNEKPLNVSSLSGVDDAGKEAVAKPSPDHVKEPHPLVSSHRTQTLPVTGSRKTDQSGDKSSSLDSDEDLDTAIKDLLKTKKKSKKKTRDLKRKSRKCLKEEEPLLGNVLLTKKFRPDPLSKFSALRKVQKSKDDMKDEAGLSKKSLPQNKQINKRKEGDAGILKGPDGRGAAAAGAAPQRKDESSSVDSDDSIELEIQRFLAEKAKVSTSEKSKDGDVSRNGTVGVCVPPRSDDSKRENQLAEIPRSISPIFRQSPGSNPTPAPQSFQPHISAVGGQSRLSSVPSGGPGLLEPADGAGAARVEQRRPDAGRGDVHSVAPQTERVRPAMSPNVAHSRSESIKWRQSLGLPTHDTRAPGRTPFLISSSETTLAAPPYQSGAVSHKSQTPGAVWSCARTSRSPFPCSAETAVNATYRSSVLNLFSAARQHPRIPFTQSLTPGRRSPCSSEGERESTVHISKDKSVFVELESNRTNHVQIQSRDRSEGKQRAESLGERKREGESAKAENKDVHLERKEEEFIDETECESVNRRNPEKAQGFSTL